MQSLVVQSVIVLGEQQLLLSVLGRQLLVVCAVRSFQLADDRVELLPAAWTVRPATVLLQFGLLRTPLMLA